MFQSVFSAAVCGVDGKIVRVEADVSDGLPSFGMVGYLSSQVKEAEERVRVALKNTGYRLPPKRITINLSPATIKKEGTAFDLPIAVAILTSLGFIPEENLRDTILIGELSLDGRVQRVNGALPIAYAAAQMGMKRCFVPAENAREAAVVQEMEAIGIHSLNETVEYLAGVQEIQKTAVNLSDLFRCKNLGHDVDFAEVTGQESAKRAIEVAVSGQHNILMIGSAGSGKTMLARRIPTIMPELTFEESMELSKVYSVSGLLDDENVMMVQRPFRSPHHSATKAALTGGGRCPRPGEVSLATKGVLFLDELPEFSRDSIEILRQPLEEKKISISRVYGNLTYPCDFMLVAAMNPCLCGFYPDRRYCRCTEGQVRRYLGKLSRPLLDRLDVCVETLPVSYQEITRIRKEETSSVIRERVMAAREVQMYRYREDGIYFNSQLSPVLIERYCCLTKMEQLLLQEAFEQFHLSARAYHRILRVARTIADMEGKDRINELHLSEAVCYRSADQKFWMGE